MSAAPREPSGQVIPYVLALVICEAIWRDLATGKCTILSCFSAIHARTFPAVYPQLAVYAAVTDGRGKVALKLKLVDAEEEAEPLFDTDFEIEFSDPRAVIEVDFQVQGLMFPSPGEYRLQMYASNEFLMERRIVVIQLPETAP